MTTIKTIHKVVMRGKPLDSKGSPTAEVYVINASGVLEATAAVHFGMEQLAELGLSSVREIVSVTPVTKLGLGLNVALAGPDIAKAVMRRAGQANGRIGGQRAAANMTRKQRKDRALKGLEARLRKKEEKG